MVQLTNNELEKKIEEIEIEIMQLRQIFSVSSERYQVSGGADNNRSELKPLWII